MSIMSQLSREVGGRGENVSSSLLEASFCFNITSLNLSIPMSSILQVTFKDVHP